MNIRIKRIDPTLPLPQYETWGSLGFDLPARETTTIAPHSIGLIPSNVIIEVPKGYMLVIASRSSTPTKRGLLTPHGIGIIDQDYCGPHDEIKIQVYNFTNEPVVIERGQKIAQGVFVRADVFSWDEVETMENKNRGGLGSTDK